MIKIIQIVFRPHQTVLVKFSNNQNLIFSVDQIVKLKLKNNQSVSANKFNRLVNSSLLFQLKAFALRQIAMSPKTSLLLKQKLLQKLKRLKVSPSSHNQLIQKILTYVQSKNLLNPAEFAAYFVKKHHQKPAFIVKNMLKQKGVDQSIVDHVGFENDDVAKIKEYLKKNHITTSILSNRTAKTKLMARLARRGFSYGSIKTAIDDCQNFS